MAQKIEQFSRLIHHRLTGSGVAFTDPTSNDHTDETWSETDLYIGEIGINVTDDTIFMRTNNGIVQISSGSTASSGSDIWSFNAGALSIGSTYSATEVTRNISSFTDLGTTALRWKDLYLGGSADGTAIININGGFTLRGSSDFIMTTISGGSNVAQINLGLTSSNGTKSNPLHLNSNGCAIVGFGGERTIMASQGSKILANSFRSAIVGGFNAEVSSNNCVYVGHGMGKSYSRSDSLGVGGKLVIVGVDDDGSGNYDSSDLVKGQERLTTSTALETPIFLQLWSGGLGEVMQIKAMVMGVDVIDPGLVYSTEILMTAAYGGASSSFIGTPIINEVSTFPDSVQVTGETDATGLEIHVKGTSTNTIKWLCSYEYHRIINI